MRKNIPLLKPISLNDENVKEKLQKENADFFFIADYGRILPACLLSLPQVFALGVHPSLLPEYRGPAPINWVIINGECETGITVFRINERVDAGEIILQRKVDINENDNINSLTRKLAKNATLVLIEAIERIREKHYSLIPQDGNLASFAKKLKKEDGEINWNLSAVHIKNLVRGTLGWPSAYTYYKSRTIQILDAEAINEDDGNGPSTIVKIDHEGIYVATKKGVLKIKKIKPQGKKEMDAWSFVCGHKIRTGEKFS
jgi:methionyl-tRNA formyltransferase